MFPRHGLTLSDVPKQRVTNLGPSGQSCPSCGAEGTLRVKEIQDMRRWLLVFRRKDREPYRVARCTECRTAIPLRRTDS